MRPFEYRLRAMLSPRHKDCGSWHVFWMGSMRASIGERQDVCSGGGHFFVDEGDADADGADMSILDLGSCNRCSNSLVRSARSVPRHPPSETIGDRWSSMRWRLGWHAGCAPRHSR